LVLLGASVTAAELGALVRPVPAGVMSETFEVVCGAGGSSAEFNAYCAFAQYVVFEAQSRVADPLVDVGMVRRAAAAATSVIERAIADNAGFDMGYVFLGRILMSQGKRTEAARRFERALTLEPRNGDARRFLEGLAAGGEPGAPSGRA